MAKEIGRLNSFAIGIEATPGTAGAIDAWIPLESGSLKPMAGVIKDESGVGNIVSPMDAHVTKQSSEFDAKGIVRPTSFGYLLLLALGQVAAPALQETGVYKHAFTVKNDNSHPAATIIRDNQTQEEQSTYNMIDSLTLTGEASEYLRFDVKTKGRKITNATGNSPAYTATGETPLLVSKASIKFAANVAGLGAASRVPVQNFKLTIEKNLEQMFSTSSDGTEAIDYITQHNKNMEIKGDFEIVYDNETYKTLALAGTLQAIEISIEGRALIGATKYEALTIQLASVVLEDWGKSDGNNDIVTQSFGFTAMYKLAETKAITADLTNTKSTIYA